MASLGGAAITPGHVPAPFRFRILGIWCAVLGDLRLTAEFRDRERNAWHPSPFGELPVQTWILAILSRMLLASAGRSPGNAQHAATATWTASTLAEDSDIEAGKMKRVWIILDLLVVPRDAACMATRPWFMSSASVARCFAVFLLILVFAPNARSQTSSGPIPPTLFGNYSELMNWPLVPTGTLAGSLVQWVYLEQTKGVYKWNNLDNYVALANSHGAEFIWNYSDAPPWAVGGGTDCTQRSNWSLPQCTCRVASDGVSTACNGGVTDLQSLHDFMVALASRYNGKSGNGRIAAYNLATEPDYYGATVTQVATQVNTMHDAIRATDTSAKIVGIALDVPSTYFAPGQYMDQFWAAGGTKDFDAISLHGYPHHAPLDNSPETIIGYTATVQACFTRNTIPSTMPIWDTESSYGDPTYGITDPNAQAGWLARAYLEHWSSGISRYYWYAYDDIPYGTLWTPSGGLDSAGIAYQQVYTWMAGATMSAPCSNGGSGTVWTCGLTLPSGVSALAVWNTAGSSSYTAAARYTAYRDLSGNTTNISGPVTIGIKPILLQSSIPPQPPTGLKAIVK